MYHQNIIDGYPDNTFRPMTPINRAELIKLLMNSLQITPDKTNNKCFKDVSGIEWYVNWVCTAQQKDWINGYSDGTFKPSTPVNKAEASKIITNVLSIKANENQNISLHIFNDVSPKSWFYPYINKLSDLYYIDWDKNFVPNASMTRGMVAEIIFRSLLAQKLYSPLEAKTVFASRPSEPKIITESESLALASRDFFRSINIIETLTLEKVEQAQKTVDQNYQIAKKTYTGSWPDTEQWNYKAMLSEGSFTMEKDGLQLVFQLRNFRQ